MTFLKSLDSPPFIATYRWAGSFDGRYMPQAYSLLLELNQHTYLPVVMPSLISVSSAAAKSGGASG